MPEWVQCIELTRLNQVLLIHVVLESLVLGLRLYRIEHSAWRLALSAKQKTVNVKVPHICTLCAMRLALCGFLRLQPYRSSAKKDLIGRPRSSSPILDASTHVE
jgi:hypothetical protein